MACVLVVEDDRELQEGLVYALRKEHYDVIAASTYNEGWNAFRHHLVHLVVLDIHLPDRSGMELCQAIRQLSDVPILFLTANDTDDEMLAGFRAGADDYMAKPFHMDIWKERIRAILRRTGGFEGQTRLFTYKDITIHYDKRTVYKHGEPLKLTTMQYKLLELLTENHKQVLTRAQLLDKLWDAEGVFVDENTLSVHMKRLRDKIEDDPKQAVYIKTVFGIGYTWGE